MPVNSYDGLVVLVMDYASWISERRNCFVGGKNSCEVM
jgi:hypothetical protein